MPQSQRIDVGSTLPIFNQGKGQRGRQIGVNDKPYKSGRFQSCRVVETGSNIFLFKVRVILENLLFRSSIGEQLQNILNPDTHAPDAGLSPTLLGVNGDAAQVIHTGVM